MLLVSGVAHGQKGEWTWISGGSHVPASNSGITGVYGVRGTPAPGNMPGGRYGATMWTDLQGNLWLFGGAGADSTGTIGSLNDLWKYSPSSGEWTWVEGSNTVPATNSGPPGSYGTKGVPSTSNIPGGRNWSVSWVDANGVF